MIKNIKHLFILSTLFSLFSVFGTAQVKPGDLVDGITAVIGDEIVLESDIQEQLNYARKQGTTDVDKCEILESVINNKLLTYEAKRDTLIENRSAAIREMAESKYAQIASQFPTEKEMLAAYNFKTSYEMKKAIEKIDTDNYYGQQKYAMITQKVDVTPNEVTDFYNTYKLQLPQVKDEVSLAQISIYPKLSEAHRQELKDKLLKIKKDIENGESFESQARIYSEDPGSASNGGLYTNIRRGQMVKQFEAAALNLQEGEISDPVETEFGYHLIQLEKKMGKLYTARHILLNATPNAEEMAAAKKELDSIRTLVMDGKMTFKEAAFKYSDDKATKFSGGTLTSPEDGSDKIEKYSLPPTIGYQIAGLNKGDITEVFEDELNRRKIVSIIQINDIIPAHQLTLETDYDRIKQLVLNKKKSEVVEAWVKDRIPTTFISIDNRYNDCSFKSNWKK